jgi:hypothetical protein
MVIKISEKFLKLIIHWIPTFEGMIIFYQAIMFDTVLNTLKPKFDISNEWKNLFCIYITEPVKSPNTVSFQAKREIVRKLQHSFY